jgi:hypothetical protein
MTPPPGGHRFQNDGADGVGAFAQDHFFDGIRRALAIVFDIPLLAIFKAMRHLRTKPSGKGPYCIAR